MNDEQWNDLKARIDEAYNVPPETPREDMWAEIAQQLPDSSDLRGSRGGRLGFGGSSWLNPSTWTRSVPWVAAAAALVLALGYGLGRWTAPVPDTDAQVAESPGTTPDAGTRPNPGTPVQAPDANPRDPGTRTLYRFAAAQHLAASSTFLGRLQNDVRAGTVPTEAGDWARDLLMETRLILDSPAVEETELRALLEDLELLLLQIAHASRAQQSGQSDLSRIELQQLNRGLDGNDLRSRIQRLVPPMLSSDL